MSGAIAFGLTGCGLMLAAWATVTAVAGRAPTPSLLGYAGLLAVSLLIAVAVEVVALTDGHRSPARPVVHGAYLALAALLVPIALVKGRGRDRSAVDSGMLGVVGVVVAIVVIRLQVTA